MIQSSILHKVRAEVERIFQEELSEEFVYHNRAHTQSVVDNCDVFAQHYELSETEREILAIAAWFHDMGYSKGYEEHEASSEKMARAFLNKLDWPADKIEQIAACIKATKVEVPPTNLMEEIIKDADLANLGEESFFDHSNRLRKEWFTILGEYHTDKGWNELNLSFLSQHEYFTAIARERLGERKRQNLQLLKKELEENSSSNNSNSTLF